jgi:3-methyladenine DNA glycosylase Tag
MQAVGMGNDHLKTCFVYEEMLRISQKDDKRQ